MVSSVFIFATYVVHSQEKIVTLSGKVQNFMNEVSDVLVVNLNTEKSTITDTQGFFKLDVKLHDSIKFSSIQYISKKISVTDSILNQHIIIVDLVEKVIKLDSVTVTPYNLTGNINTDVNGFHLKPVITASSLGLPNSDIELMTHSERLLLEADRGKFGRLATIDDYGKLAHIAGYLSFSVIINTHKIMNRASGRTKALKNRVARDRNLILENKIKALFLKETISDAFKIPESNIDGFFIFCAAQEDFQQLSEVESNTQIWGYLKRKSVEYKEVNNLN